MFDIVVKTPFGMLRSSMRVCGFKSWPHSRFQLLAKTYPERKQIMVEVRGSMLPLGKTWIESLGRISPAIIGTGGVNKQMGELCPPVS